jgi:uncharacterized LabA/DUF88 family protein
MRGQRVGVFIDVQNMYYSAKNLYDAKVNFKEILRTAVAGRTLIRAIAYVIRADIKEEKNFFEALSKIGYEVKAKDLQTFVGGAKKGDWDVGIAMDMIELGNKLDVVVLVSGDGDYVPLVQHMGRAMGCKVEAMAFGRTSSGKLKDAVDIFTDMEKYKSRFLIRSMSRNSKGGSSQGSPAAKSTSPKPSLSSKEGLAKQVMRQ